VDVVELLREQTLVFYVVDFEVAVGGDVGGSGSVVRDGARGGGPTHNCGWIGLRSQPITVADGKQVAGYTC
jgi:hypothetical protein